MANYYVTVYNTNKQDFEVDRYLTESMKVKFEGDIKPVAQYICSDWHEASALYNKLCQDNNVVAKFEGKHLLCAHNKNHLYV